MTLSANTTIRTLVISLTTPSAAVEDQFKWLVGYHHRLGRDVGHPTIRRAAARFAAEFHRYPVIVTGGAEGARHTGLAIADALRAVRPALKRIERRVLKGTLR